MFTISDKSYRGISAFCIPAGNNIKSVQTHSRCNSPLRRVKFKTCAQNQHLCLQRGTNGLVNRRKVAADSWQSYVRRNTGYSYRFTVSSGHVSFYC